MENDENESREWQKAIIALAKKRINNLSKEEISEYNASDMELLVWLKSKFDCPNTTDFINWKRDYEKQKGKNRKTGETSIFSPSKRPRIADDSEDKTKRAVLKLRKSFIVSHKGFIIAITVLSRSLRADEVDAHRSINCIFMEDFCTLAAGHNNVPSFSCLLCPQACNPKTQSTKLDICNIARM